MEKQIRYARWIEAETNIGTEAIEFDLVFSRNDKTTDIKYLDIEDYIEGSKLYSAEIRDGYGARLSMPGYLDCTPWAVFDTEEEASDFLIQMYGND